MRAVKRMDVEINCEEIILYLQAISVGPLLRQPKYKHNFPSLFFVKTVVDLLFEIFSVRLSILQIFISGSNISNGRYFKTV